MIERVVYKQDSFTDFAGNERKFIVCAVSREVDHVMVEYPYKKEITGEPVEKELSIGFAICRINDEFNEEIGKQIAYNKAVSAKNSLKMFVTFSGMINTPVVDALLTQEIEYFKRNPQAHIAGYNEEKHQYELSEANKAKIANIWSNLNNQAKQMVEFAKQQTQEVRDAIITMINAEN